MEKLFEELGIKLTKKQAEMFDKYYRLLIEYNNKFNITAITEREEVYKKHFVDSLVNVEKLKGEKLIDIGSGGGFPAVPIKIIREDLDVTMVEATGKKCEFLKVLITSLNLKNIRVINGRAEDLGKDLNYREKFDICTARAVARLNSLSEYCMPFVKIGGTFVAYKGSLGKEELTESQNAIKVLGGEVLEQTYFELFNENRSIITIKKINKTDKKYPRGNGKERKCPL